MRTLAKFIPGSFMPLLLVAVLLAGAVPASAQGSSARQVSPAQLFEWVWSAVSATFAGTPQVNWDEVGEQYRSAVYNAPSLDEAYLLLQEMVDLLGDAGTFIRTPAEVEEALARPDSSSIIGVGMLLDTTSAGEVFILDVLRGGPADRAGVRRGERVVAVDGVSMAGKNAGDVASSIRGDQGTTVELTLADPDGRERTLAITRAPVTFRSEFEARTISGDIGYISVPTLRSGSELDFLSALRRMYRTNGLVVDLRRFDGIADVGTVLRIAGLFTQEPLGAFVTRQGAFTLEPERGWGETGSFTVPPPTALDYYRKPLVFLVEDVVAINPFSLALVSGMQESGRATLVGRGTEPGASFGDGQVYYDLPGGGILSITASYLASLNSRNFVTQIAVDVPIPIDRDYLAALHAGDDMDLRAAANALGR